MSDTRIELRLRAGERDKLQALADAARMTLTEYLLVRAGVREGKKK